MTVTLVPPGRGRWSPLVLRWDERRRGELPLPVGIKRGDLVLVMGATWRVQRVDA